MAIRDENDNKITPLIPSVDEEKVIKTAIWKMGVEEAMSKIDHGRYEYCPNGKVGEMDFTKAAQMLPEAGKRNFMIFIKSPVEQPYNYVGKDNCENACFAVVVIRHKGTGAFNDPHEFYNLALFGLRDGILKADNRLGTGQPVLLGIDCLTVNKNNRWCSEEIQKRLNTLVSWEYCLFKSNETRKREAPDCIKTYIEMTGATEKQACQELMRQLNAWPDGVRSHSELLDAVVNKVGVEKIERAGKHADEYLDLLVAKEHWLDMKAANEKGLLYPSGPFSGMIQPGECADPDKMLAMIDEKIIFLEYKFLNDPKATIKPLRNQSERGER